MKLLAQRDISEIIGEISPPPGPDIFNTGNVGDAVGKLLSFTINMFFLVGGITMLVYLLWGSLDWITSGGDKENMQKARKKITNAILGMLLLVIVFALWVFITGDILGIINVKGGGFNFSLPTIDSQTGGGGTYKCPGRCVRGISCPAGMRVDPKSNEDTCPNKSGPGSICCI